MAKSPEHIDLKNLNVSYSALGRYVATFEQVVFFMRTWITMTLQLGGLKRQELAWAVVNSNAMTAGPMLTVIQSMMADMQFYSDEQDPGSKKILDRLYKDIQDAIEERNKIVHGTWFIPQQYGVVTNPEGLFGFKGTSGKKGAAAAPSAHTPATLATRSDELEELAQKVMRAAMTCASHLFSDDTKQKRFTEMFWWDGDILREGRPPEPSTVVADTQKTAEKSG